jgi:uncharacterized protein YegP (UPF0339 family)
MTFHVYRARRGILLRTQWRWRLKAKNGLVIATSGEGYSNKGDALRAIQLVQDSASAIVKVES